MRFIKYVAVVIGFALISASSATGAALVTGAKIKDGTVTSKDLSKGLRRQIARSVTFDSTGPVAGPSGAVGATGAKGDTGATGATGRDGLVSIRYVPQGVTMEPTGVPVTVTVPCPAGTVGIAGTWDNSLLDGAELQVDGIVPSASGVTFTLRRSAGGTATHTVRAICG